MQSTRILPTRAECSPHSKRPIHANSVNPRKTALRALNLEIRSGTILLKIVAPDPAGPRRFALSCRRASFCPLVHEHDGGEGT
jgi:hypothetical protein